MRLANAGRALVMAAWIDALNVWQSGYHARGLVIAGAGTFVFGLLMFEGCEWWERRGQADMSSPPPPLPPGALGSARSSSLDGGGGNAGD